VAQHAIRTPFLSQFDRCAIQISLKLLQFSFQPGKERESIRRGARKAYENAIVIDAPDLSGVMLNDRVPEGYLAVAGNGYSITPLYEKNGCAMNDFVVSFHNRAV
jgi:hypothetical protein